VQRGDGSLDRVRPGRPAHAQRPLGQLPPLVDRVEAASVEQVGCVHGVPCLPQLVRERPDSLGQALDVVVQHDFGHLESPSAIDP